MSNPPPDSDLSRPRSARMYEYFPGQAALAHHWRPEVRVALPGQDPVAPEEFADVDVSIWAGVGLKP